MDVYSSSLQPHGVFLAEESEVWAAEKSGGWAKRLEMTSCPGGRLGRADADYQSPTAPGDQRTVTCCGRRRRRRTAAGASRPETANGRQKRKQQHQLQIKTTKERRTAETGKERCGSLWRRVVLRWGAPSSSRQRWRWGWSRLLLASSAASGGNLDLSSTRSRGPQTFKPRPRPHRACTWSRVHGCLGPHLSPLFSTAASSLSSAAYPIWFLICSISHCSFFSPA